MYYTLSDWLFVVHEGGMWGTVCDDGWSTEDAQVVCHQLGFQGIAIALSMSGYGKGTGNIWMDEVNCKGTENRLQVSRKHLAHIPACLQHTGTYRYIRTYVCM